MTVKVQQIEMLSQALQFTAQSQQVVGQNLANINTPGYQAKEIPFEQLLEKLNSGKTSQASYDVKEVAGLMPRSDGNNVDLDRELAAMKKDALAYQTLTQLLGSKIGILKQAING